MSELSWANSDKQQPSVSGILSGYEKQDQWMGIGESDLNFIRIISKTYYYLQKVKRSETKTVL